MDALTSKRNVLMLETTVGCDWFDSNSAPTMEELAAMNDSVVMKRLPLSTWIFFTILPLLVISLLAWFVFVLPRDLMVFSVMSVSTVLASVCALYMHHLRLKQGMKEKQNLLKPITDNDKSIDAKKILQCRANQLEQQGIVRYIDEVLDQGRTLTQGEYMLIRNTLIDIITKDPTNNKEVCL